jgi:hypothetical protein
MFQSEAEMVRVEGHHPSDIPHLIAHAVQAEDDGRFVCSFITRSSGCFAAT